MRAVSNVCGAAYTLDKELYNDCLGRASQHTSGPLIIFRASGPSEAVGCGVGGASALSEV